jgi:hypothetical protein
MGFIIASEVRPLPTGLCWSGNLQLDVISLARGARFARGADDGVRQSSGDTVPR